MQIDLNHGAVKAYSATDMGKYLIINANADNYPIELGNVKFKWDGSMDGGSTYSWSIDSSGKARFNSMVVNGGSIGGVTISHGDIAGSGWSLSEDGATFTKLTVGNYIFEPITINYSRYTGIEDITQDNNPSNNSGAFGYVSGFNNANKVKLYIGEEPVTDKQGNHVEVITKINPTYKMASFSQYTKTICGLNEEETEE